MGRQLALDVERAGRRAGRPRRPIETFVEYATALDDLLADGSDTCRRLAVDVEASVYGGRELPPEIRRADDRPRPAASASIGAGEAGGTSRQGRRQGVRRPLRSPCRSALRCRPWTTGRRCNWHWSEARRAGDAGEVPVGAVVVSGDRVVAVAGQPARGRQRPDGHAEILALRQAAAETGAGD